MYHRHVLVQYVHTKWCMCACFPNDQSLRHRDEDVCRQLRLRSAASTVAQQSTAPSTTRATKKLMQILLRAAWVEDVFRRVAKFSHVVTRDVQGSDKQLYALLQALGMSEVRLTQGQIDEAFQGPEGVTPADHLVYLDLVVIKN